MRRRELTLRSLGPVTLKDVKEAHEILGFIVHWLSLLRLGAS